MGGFSHEPSASRPRNRDVTCKGGAVLVEGMETRFRAGEGCEIDADIGNAGGWREDTVSVGYKAQKWKQKCKKKT